MPTAALLSFSLVALLTVLTPGLDTVMVLRTALLSGKRAAMGVVLGITLGCLVWAVASLAGLTALLQASAPAYDVVRWLGAAYLIYLGAKALWNSRKAVSLDDSRSVPGAGASLRAGLLTNLLNPKVGVFYLSLLPQFMPAGEPAWGAALVAIHLGLGLVWLPILIAVAGRARAFLLRQRVLLDRLTASVFVALGLKLAFDAR
ncbi:LysE family translocator [Lentzea flaviverrucosa]|uniref:Threonine/homoserine/homoserine lactone efflux protein n=1 Tax=Lentzea flaviverrucosa TaxID=200379 RepID=A0A1H9UWP1_9PSEU|nr:LysE family translocator [Lentzea flaviverrucosa]RDI27694.1 threonine/homoserine/homoserine lactone efflux protein [Lentzea flaviverrucosa]SES13748.1 Threonine/homoserine/homoserine lactone efflux protein [Lentzea flaviverrucosa]